MICCFFGALAVLPAGGSDLKAETVAAFDRYIRATEARMAEDVSQDQFLVVDRLPEAHRQQAYDQLKKGLVYIQELHSREDDSKIHVQDGLIHHWAGVVFVPNAKLSDVIAVLQDYPHHGQIYKPDVRQAELIEQHGDESKIRIQFFNKSGVTVALNVDFDVTDTRFGTERFESASRSTRIAEIGNLGRSDEHELPAGKDHGYMWRLFTYWRLEEKDGGVYVQNESVELSRSVPFLLAWLVNPLLKSIPHNVITNLLTDTRDAVVKPPS